jgi:CDP-diacylglycerol--serine O-phosphatidyltransferase
MNALTRNIPNFITLSNLLCGVLSIIFAFDNNLILAAIFIFLGNFLDFFDGFFARLLKVEDKFGLQLDSMADLITSGLAPGIILFHLIKNQSQIQYPDTVPLAFLALIIPVFSAIRLSNFNIDLSQKNSFIGLPTPMLAIFIAAIPLINLQLFPIYSNIIFLCGISIVLSFLLISKINLFSLKVNLKKISIDKLNILRVILLSSSIILFLLFNFAAIPFIVILYIILSLINNI